MTSEVTRAKAAIMQFHEESTRINLHSLGPALTRRHFNNNFIFQSYLHLLNYLSI